MLLNLSQIGQIALPVSDVDRSEEFYANVVGLRKLYRYGNLTFFDCAGVRLLLEKVRDGATPRRGGCIYFRCADIALTVTELKRRGVTLTHQPHLIAKMEPRSVDGVLRRSRRPHPRGDAGGAQGVCAGGDVTKAIELPLPATIPRISVLALAMDGKTPARP
jgi:methylmalonyl-CoA/ethylmalonyl-CoA epimerase